MSDAFEPTNAIESGPLFTRMARFDPDLSPARRDQAIQGVIVPPAAPKATESDPVSYLLNLMDTEPDPDLSPEQRLFHESMRLKAAIAAAPFKRPKLAQVELSGKLTVSHEDALAELD